MCAIFLFGWALGITVSDYTVTGVIDPTVFMTFSLTAPLSFYLFPVIYAVIVAAADVLMLYFIVRVSGAAGPLINTSIFFIFQIVLGISFLRLKMNLAERILKEQDNAGIDILTGFANRRTYEDEIKKLSESPRQEDIVYIAFDLNGLKEVNDRYGHAAGDSLIVGAARCIEQCFGDRGRAFRIGGDEFAALICAEQNEMERLLGGFERVMKKWSDDSGIPLSAACGWVSHAEFPEKSITELAREADRRMYAEKARYYRTQGRDRRSYRD